MFHKYRCHQKNRKQKQIKNHIKKPTQNQNKNKNQKQENIRHHTNPTTSNKRNEKQEHRTPRVWCVVCVFPSLSPVFLLVVTLRVEIRKRTVCNFKTHRVEKTQSVLNLHTGRLESTHGAQRQRRPTGDTTGTPPGTPHTTHTCLCSYVCVYLFCVCFSFTICVF